MQTNLVSLLKKAICTDWWLLAGNVIITTACTVFVSVSVHGGLGTKLPVCITVNNNDKVPTMKYLYIVLLG